MVYYRKLGGAMESISYRRNYGKDTSNININTPIRDLQYSL
jgi:hypothetical protein